MFLFIFFSILNTRENRNIKDILYKLFSNCSRLFYPLRFFFPFLNGNIHRGRGDETGIQSRRRRGGKKRREGGKRPRRKIKPRNFNDTVDAGGWPGWKFPCFDK